MSETLYDCLNESTGTAIQERFFEKYRNNQILINAMGGTQSIEDTVLELDSDMKGIKRYLPRRKNKAYNERVEQLSELIPKAGYLKRNGVFSLDNFINSGLLGAGLAYGMIYLSLYVLSEPLTPEKLEIVHVKSKIAALLGLLITGSARHFPRTDGREATLKHAQYLDNKINELFR